MLVVVAVLAVLAFIILTAMPGRTYINYHRTNCLNNLKEIGTAYRLWAGDHGDLVPYQRSVSDGGWKELLTNADQGAICWRNYATMSNELGMAPKLVVCRSDERQAAAGFATNFDNNYVSYFVGMNATSPHSIQGGDRNLGPGALPDANYGYSPADGTGNDVAIPISGPVSWSLKMHSMGKIAGAGNILLGDGSAQQVSTASFNKDWLRNAPPTTNWPASHVPAIPSIRLIFP